MLEEFKKSNNMKSLRSVEEIGTTKRVILRIDSDVPISEGQILDNSRLVKSVGTIKLLLERGSRIMIIGHRGRPTGSGEMGKPENYNPEFSLKPVYLELMSILGENGVGVESVFLDDVMEREKISSSLESNQILFFENLRFWKDEEENKSEFLRYLIEMADAYVNDAFAVAHRNNASITLWQTMETYYGLSFVEEAEKIERVISNAQRPITVVLGGAKKDKLDYLPELIRTADKVLIGGKLPKIMEGVEYDQNGKVMVGELTTDGFDINEETRRKFGEIIDSSGTVIWAGAMGFYEDPNHRQGTQEIALSVANVRGYKIIAGGDTSASVLELGLKDKIDYVCSGGGVMLEYLTKGKLPAWE
jgi:phosphoglycerate kinase